MFALTRIARGSAFAAILCSFAMGPATCFGQFGGRRVNTIGRLFTPPRTLSAQISEAAEAVEQREYSTAASLLGGLLQRGEDLAANDRDLTMVQDYFVDAEVNSRTVRENQESLLRKVRRMIGDLPPKGIDAYEILYGPIANRELNQAEESRDWDAVERVRRRYSHTKAGHQATLLLAQRAMFQGHPLEASLLLDEIVMTAGAVEHFGPSVIAMHAIACRAGGRDVPDLAQIEGESVSVSGTAQEVPDATEFDQWLARIYPGNSLGQPEQLGSYPWLGGAPNRNGDTSAEMPLQGKMWMIETTSAPRQSRDVWRRAGELRRQGYPTIPSTVPLRVGSLVLMRTTDRLFGIDVETGKRIFPFPTSAASVVTRNRQVDPTTRQAENDDDKDGLLNQRVWADAPYGLISSDGDRVYLLHRLDSVDLAPVNGFGGRIRQSRGQEPNSLVALELATDGKILWEVGGAEDSETTTPSTFFLGPPLPIDGKLYIIAESSGDIDLRCLDPVTGKEIWRQQLVAAAESGGIGKDNIRRIAGATPTYHEGILICPTGTGVTVAVDLVDRTLRWAHVHSRYSQFQPGIYNNGTSLNSYAKRWQSSAAIASKASVFLTPVESNVLIGCDAVDGAPLFPPIPRGNANYLAGVRDGQAIVVSPDHVTAYDAKLGGVLWETADNLLSPGQSVCGFGVFGDGTYLLPTSTDELIMVSTADGTEIERRTVDFQLGNLVCNDGIVFSQGVTELSAAFGEASLRPMVQSLLDSSPENLFALLRKAELQLQSEEQSEALKTLRRASTIDASNDEIHELTVVAMLGILRESDSPDLDFIAELDDLIDDPQQRSEFMRLRISNSIANSNYKDAVVQLLRLSDLACTDDQETKLFLGESGNSTSIDGWISGRTAQVAQMVEAETSLSLQQIVSEFISARSFSPTAQLRRMIGHFKPLGGVSGLETALARRIGNGVSPLDIERTVLGAVTPTNMQLAGLSEDELNNLASAYSAGRLTNDASFVNRILKANEQADAPLSMKDIAELSATSRSPSLQQTAWPTPVRSDWKSSAPRTSFRGAPRSSFARTHYSDSREFSAWRVVTGGGRAVEFRDEQGRRHPLGFDVSQYSESSVTEVIISGSVAVLVFKTEIVAVSLYAVRDHDPEPILWRRTLSSDGKPQFRNGSRRTFADDVFYYRLDQARAVKPSPELFVGPILGDRIFIRNGSELSCVDLLSSQTLWSVTAKINNGVTIAQNGQVALVSPESDFIEVFDLYDGQMRETKPWEPGFIWTSTSSSVLTSRRVAETQGRRNVIELSAPLGDQPKLQTERQSPDKIQEGDESTYGRVVGKRWLFLTSRDGKITVWDLLNHREIVSEEFAGFDKLNKMHGAQIGDQLIVLADQLQSVDEPKFNQTTSEFAEAANQSHYGARGVFAFDVVTGKLRWKREFKRPWGCTTMQPAGTPLLILTRSRTLLATSRGTPNKREMDMLGLDINTGETLLENIAMDVPVSTVSATQTTLLPLKNQMLVTAESSIVTLEFGGPEENDGNAKSIETSGSKNTPETPREPKKGATPEDD